MKRFLLLAFVTVSAQAACDYTITENVTRSAQERNQILCDVNFRCAEKALRAGEDVDSYTNYSRAHQCNDELKLASLFASFDAEEETTYSTAKTDLPVIPDAPDRAPAQIKE